MTKGTDKQYVTVFFVPNFRILTQVVAEKSLMDKKFTDRQTNKITKITEKAKTIYLLYTSHRGYYKVST